MTICMVVHFAALLAVALAPVAARADDAGLVARGEYLTRAADCAACHKSPNGAAWRGGRPFTLPYMWILYSANITPDPDTGIGRYTDDEWVRMMHEGIGRGGKHLYPAMPYNSYTLMSRDDALSIKAYLFAQPAAHTDVPPNQMMFPFSQRWLMAGWNLLNNPAHRLAPAVGKSADWNRGAYLVEALGHCAQCHTPRNLMQGLSGRQFAGNEEQGWVAYNLTSDKDHGIGGWTDAELVQYLGTGHAAGRGIASGPMAEAVENSLQYMTPVDLQAMVTYLRDIPARPDGAPAVAQGSEKRAVDQMSASTGRNPSFSLAAAAATSDQGARIFAQACAGCHLPSGGGRQSPWAALGGDHSTGDVSGANVIQVLLNGSQLDTPLGLMFMHGFKGAYTNIEMAAVSNYVIAQYSGRTGTVAPADFETTDNTVMITMFVAAGVSSVVIVVFGAVFLLKRRRSMTRQPAA